MKTATVFVAVDGRQFNEAAKARDYEEGLFRVWLKENPGWSDFLKAGDPDDKHRERIVREFWEWNCCK